MHATLRILQGNLKPLYQISPGTTYVHACCNCTAQYPARPTYSFNLSNARRFYSSIGKLCSLMGFLTKKSNNVYSIISIVNPLSRNASQHALHFFLLV